MPCISESAYSDPYELPLPSQLELNVPSPLARSSPPTSLESAIEPEVQAQHKITHIVSILQGWPSRGPHHLSIDLNDDEMENLLVHFPRVCDFIDQALDSGGIVLVHCFAGISRSASCVIAYGTYQIPDLAFTWLSFCPQ